MQSAREIWNGFWLWFVAYLILTPVVTFHFVQHVVAFRQDPSPTQTAWLALYVLLAPYFWYQVVSHALHYWRWRSSRR